MSRYNEYVFDQTNRRFLGQFEDMYSQEDAEGYESWYQYDVTFELRTTISNLILSRYAFQRVLDLGCGKGAFTAQLRRQNNHVVGVDCAATAIKKAQTSFRGIDFRVMRMEDVLSIGETFDLVVAMGTFAYVDVWRKVIRDVSHMTTYFYSAEHIPPNPIGFVKSPDDLLREMDRYFDIETKLLLDDRHVMALGKVKHTV